MSKTITGLALALGLATLAPVAAQAHDYESGYGYRAAGQVREEREELEAARHKLHRALENRDYYGAHRAAHQLREEREELRAARNRLHAQHGYRYYNSYDNDGGWRPARFHRWW